MQPHNDTGQAARYLGISIKTLERWRYEGRGPVFRKFGKRVLYSQDELDRWAKDQERTSTSMQESS